MIALVILKKYWREFLIVGLLLAGFLYMQNLYSTISTQAATITKLTTANGILTENNTKLQKTIDVNNAAIDKLAQGAADTSKAFSTLSITVKQQTSNLSTQLRTILTEKKPQTCADTIKYLIDASKGYSK